MCVLWPVLQCNDELRTGHEASCACINCAFHATVTELLMRRRLPVPSQARPPISAIALLKILRDITKKFAEKLQHDSSELYDSLLEQTGLGQQCALHFRRKGTCAACTYKFEDNCTRGCYGIRVHVQDLINDNASTAGAVRRWMVGDRVVYMRQP